MDISLARDICRKLFKYRKVHAWPPTIAKGDEWENIYDAQRRGLDVLPTVDEAIAWANALIDKIDNSFAFFLWALLYHKSAD